MNLVLDDTTTYLSFFRGSDSKQAKAFRSDYFHIAELRSILRGEDKVPVVVLTATATPYVEKQIVTNLQMNNVTRLVSPPDRPNIRYSVVRIKDDREDEYFSWLIEELLKQGYYARRVIIFCRSHAHCRSLYKLFHVSLKSCKYSSYTDRPFAMFHAGTDDEIKSFILESFSKENGTVRVLFATTAFGMGVDCKGLNLVIHYGPPNNVDDYVQESGRAGRDNSKSHAVLQSYPRCTSGNVSESMKKYVKTQNFAEEKCCWNVLMPNPAMKLVNMTAVMFVHQPTILDFCHLLKIMSVTFQYKRKQPAI